MKQAKKHPDVESLSLQAFKKPQMKRHLDCSKRACHASRSQSQIHRPVDTWAELRYAEGRPNLHHQIKWVPSLVANPTPANWVKT